MDDSDGFNVVDGWGWWCEVCCAFVGLFVFVICVWCFHILLGACGATLLLGGVVMRHFGLWVRGYFCRWLVLGCFRVVFCWFV